MAKMDKLKQIFEIYKIILSAILIIDGFLAGYLFNRKYLNTAFDIIVFGVLIICIFLTIIVIRKMFDNANEQEELL